MPYLELIWFLIRFDETESIMQPTLRNVLFIHCGHAIVQVGILLLWFDALENLFEPIRFWVELVTIIGVLVLAIYLFKFIHWLISKNGNIHSFRLFLGSLIFSAIIPILLSTTYIIKVIDHQILHNDIRKRMTSTILKSGPYELSHLSNDLNVAEYNQLKAFDNFPTLPSSAHHISFSRYSGELTGDYQLMVSYRVPLTTKIKPFSLQKGEWYRKQTVENKTNCLQVTWLEGQR